MLCVCDRQCQVRDDAGAIRFFKKGEVFDFKECPVHFTPVESKVVDFATASEDELLHSKWSFKEISTFARETFGKEMAKGSKRDLVSQLLDLRFRQVA